MSKKKEKQKKLGFFPGIYLKWLHPWKILLQEVSFPWFYFFLLKLLPFRSKTSGRSRMTQANEVVLLFSLEFWFIWQQILEDPVRDVAASQGEELRRKFSINFKIISGKKGGSSPSKMQSLIPPFRYNHHTSSEKCCQILIVFDAKPDLNKYI